MLEHICHKVIPIVGQQTFKAPSAPYFWALQSRPYPTTGGLDHIQLSLELRKANIPKLSITHMDLCKRTCHNIDEGVSSFNSKG